MLFGHEEPIVLPVEIDTRVDQVERGVGTYFDDREMSQISSGSELSARQ